jgi:hypothetical protein
MKKDLNVKQLLILGAVMVLIAKFPVGRVLGVTLELGGVISILMGFIKGIVYITRGKGKSNDAK